MAKTTSQNPMVVRQRKYSPAEECHWHRLCGSQSSVCSPTPNRGHNPHQGPGTGHEGDMPSMLALHRTAEIITKKTFDLRSVVSVLVRQSNRRGCVSMEWCPSAFSCGLQRALPTQQFCELTNLEPFLHFGCIARIPLTQGTYCDVQFCALILTGPTRQDLVAEGILGSVRSRFGWIPQCLFTIELSSAWAPLETAVERTATARSSIQNWH